MQRYVGSFYISTARVILNCTSTIIIVSSCRLHVNPCEMSYKIRGYIIEVLLKTMNILCSVVFCA